MRTGVTERADKIGGARGNGRGHRSTLARLASYLFSALLLLQLAGPTHHPIASAAPTSAKAAALASLGAAIGHAVTLCEHDGDPSHPGDPTHPSGCEHCVFCQSVAVGFAPDPPVSTSLARLPISIATQRPREDAAFVRERYAGGATPRGPPALG